MDWLSAKHYKKRKRESYLRLPYRNKSLNQRTRSRIN
uniref:Uncharacterized protein n=1 Tax=Arundo donax TaxID=35708 RepID=A0A0A8Z3B5_ARUDO